MPKNPHAKAACGPTQSGCGSVDGFLRFALDDIDGGVEEQGCDLQIVCEERLR